MNTNISMFLNNGVVITYWHISLGGGGGGGGGKFLNLHSFPTRRPPDLGEGGGEVGVNF